MAAGTVGTTARQVPKNTVKLGAAVRVNIARQNNKLLNKRILQNTVLKLPLLPNQN
jgi:hypothetical protein